MEFAEVISVSSAKGDNIAALEEAVLHLLPEGVHVFPDDQLTDRSERFFAAELIREKLLRILGAEVPHRLLRRDRRVEVRTGLGQHLCHDLGRAQRAEAYRHRSGGAVLKRVGEEVGRLDMERMFGRRVLLRTWVKVKEHWSDDVRSLQRLGVCD